MERSISREYAVSRQASPSRHGHEAPDHAAIAKMAVMDMRNMARRGARLIGFRRAALPDRLELRLLFVAQPAIEVVERGAHGLHRLPHGLQPLVGGIEPGHRR